MHDFHISLRQLGFLGKCIGLVQVIGFFCVIGLKFDSISFVLDVTVQLNCFSFDFTAENRSHRGIKTELEGRNRRLVQPLERFLHVFWSQLPIRTQKFRRQKLQGHVVRKDEMVKRLPGNQLPTIL